MQRLENEAHLFSYPWKQWRALYLKDIRRFLSNHGIVEQGEGGWELTRKGSRIRESTKKEGCGKVRLFKRRDYIPCP